MLTHEKVLKVFGPYLDADPDYEVVKASRGYTLLAGTHNLRFELRCGELPTIPLLLDTTLIERMIDNVISNFIRYAKEQITMDDGWQSGQLSICICDDGPGFPENALKATATVFYMENSENDHFGLGLSICDTLCRKQGGTLALRNGKIDGACIVMSIAATFSGRMDNE